MSEKKPQDQKAPGTTVATTEEQQENALEAELLGTAKTLDERKLAFELASRVRQQQMIRKAALAAAEVGWGKDISPVARAAVVRYCMEIGADPLRHVYVLGGSTVYLNAEFYRDLCAANPEFLMDDVRFIHADPRAGEEEAAERARLRVQYGVPEEAPGAAIVTLHYRSKRGPFVGVNWAGVRKNDPVGTQEPTKTAHSRAYRKAAMKAESAWFRTHPTLAAAHEILAQGKALGEVVPTPFGGEPVPTAAGEPVDTAAVEIPAESKDPYTGDAVMTRHAPSAICDKAAEHPVSECGYGRK